MDGGRQPPAIGVSFKRMHRMAIAGAGRREARRAECKERGGKRGLESQRRRRIENGAERDRKGTAGQAEENHPDRQCKPHAPPARTTHAFRTDHRKRARKGRMSPAEKIAHELPRTSRTNRPGQTSEAVHEQTAQTGPDGPRRGRNRTRSPLFKGKLPPKWTKSEKFSLLLRENRQQTETRYGIQFQGD